MYQTSQKYKDYMASTNRQFEVQAIINSVIYASDEVIEFNIEDAITCSEELTIGTIIPAKLTIKIKTTNTIASNAKVEPQLRLNGTSGYTEWIQMGCYYIDTRSYSNGVWTFECVDKLITTEQPYTSILTYPCAMADVFAEILNILNLQSDVIINPAFQIPYKDESISIREMLSCIASAHGANVKLSRDEKLIFVPLILTTPVATITASNYIKAEQTNAIKTFTRLEAIINSESETVIRGTGDADHTLNFENRFMFLEQAQADYAFSVINNFSYTPYNINWTGRPDLDVGDTIKIVLLDETEITTIIAINKIIFKGGLLQNSSVPSKSEQQNEYKFQGSLSKQLSQKLVKDQPYYGVSFGPNNGLKITQSDGNSEAIFNSDKFAMRALEDGVMKDKLYFDPVKGKYVFDGELAAGSITISSENISGTLSDSQIASAANWNSAFVNTSLALTQLNDISSDDKLTPDEKISVKREFDIITSEKTLISNQATNYGISGTNYDADYMALYNYITPLLFDMDTTSDIVRTTFDTKFKNYYDQKTNIINAISNKLNDTKTNSTQVTTIIGNTVTTGYVNALSINAATVDTLWLKTVDLSASQITTGTLSANRINGGTLSGVTLDVNTNATIGKQLMIGSMQDASDKYIKFGDNMYIFTSSDGLNLALYNYEGDISNSAKGDYKVTAQDTLQLTGLEGITLTTGDSSVNINGASLIFENRTEEDGNSGYYDIINTAIGNDVLNANTTGSWNTVLGFKNLYSNTTGGYNVAIGSWALYNNITGYSNVAIGDSALYSNTTGYSNVAIGDSVLYLNTIGRRNVAIGDSVLYSNTTGSYNVAVGYSTLRYNTTGNSNVAIGDNALYYNTTGRCNVAIGDSALSSNKTGNYNVAIGETALINNTTGYSNTAVGMESLHDNTTGSKNTAIGYEALLYNEDGSNNTAVGHSSLCYNVEGNGNTAVGYHSLEENWEGYNNTAIGIYSLYYNETGYFNTAIGGDALSYNTTGYYNTAVGYDALGYNENGYSNTAIGGDAGQFLRNGNYNTNPSQCTYLGTTTKSNTTNATNEIVIGYNASGYGDNTAHIGNSSVTSISFGAGTGTAFTNRSDRRLKEDIQDADTSICYNDIKNLPLHRFKYKDFVGNTGDQHLTGFIADEFEQVLPKAVFKNDLSFPLLDEDGNPIMKTISEEVIEIVKDEDKVKEIKAKYEVEKTKVAEKVARKTLAEQEKEELKTATKTITKTVERQVEETFVIEDCASIDTSQLTPTIVGAIKALIDKVETLEAKVKELGG